MDTACGSRAYPRSCYRGELPGRRHDGASVCGPAEWKLGNPMVRMVLVLSLLLFGVRAEAQDVSVTVLSTYHWEGRDFASIRVENLEQRRLEVRSDSVFVLSVADRCSDDVLDAGSWLALWKGESFNAEAPTSEQRMVRIAVPLRQREGRGYRKWISLSELVELEKPSDLISLAEAVEVASDLHTETSSSSWEPSLQYDPILGTRVWCLSARETGEGVVVDALTGVGRLVPRLPNVD